ncbi:MAG TPA: hypothetical protein VGK56_11075 [Anaerolineales bacterium]
MMRDIFRQLAEILAYFCMMAALAVIIRTSIDELREIAQPSVRVEVRAR